MVGYLTSQRAVPLSLGWYSFPTPLRVGGLGLSGWLHTIERSAEMLSEVRCLRPRPRPIFWPRG